MIEFSLLKYSARSFPQEEEPFIYEKSIQAHVSVQRILDKAWRNASYIFSYLCLVIRREILTESVAFLEYFRSESKTMFC